MAVAVVVGYPEHTTKSLLAAEALRKAAAATQTDVQIEVRINGVVRGALNPQVHSDLLLVVGEPEGTLPSAGRVERVSLDAVLQDAAKVLAGLHAAGAVPAEVVPICVVAVTSCPTGIAHTFMAAEGLEQGAKKLGYCIRVETQGSVGANNALTTEEIAAADIVILAADRQVSRDRFDGKRVYACGTKPAISDGAGLITKALADATPQGTASATQNKEPATQERAGIYKHLMTGVSFMLPFVVAGGLLIALAFALGGIYAGKTEGTFAYALFTIGAKAAFSLMVPALAGYVAFSIADRPGLAPGMIGGVLAMQIGSGFLGGILAGFIAGYAAKLLNRYIRLPQGLDGLKPVLVLPLLATLITGLAMLYVVGTPAAELLRWLTSSLQSLKGSSAWLLGAILGGMMAVDLGGPVNKAAYAFSTGLLTSNIFAPMAATMAGGMTPPLALFLATRFFRGRFTAAEYQSGPATGLLGLAFISEGALPYVARDPLRIIPALIAGSAVAGALAMAFGTDLRAPHGGVFVMLIPNAVSHVGAYVLAIVIGSLVSAFALRFTLARQKN